MKKIFILALLSLLFAACENEQVDQNNKYQTFELQMNEKKTVTVDNNKFEVELIDFEDKVEEYKDGNECGLGDSNRIYVSLKINGTHLSAHSKIGGPDSYDLSLNESSVIIAQALETINKQGISALEYVFLYDRSTEITSDFMISFDYAAPNRYSETLGINKKDYKFVFTIYSKKILL